MENREAFTGISAEPEESVDEINWRQKNYNQASRNKSYSTRGIGRGIKQNNKYYHNNTSRGRGYETQGGNPAKREGTNNNSDIQCLLCGLKGHKVTTCRKLSRAQKLLRKDKHRYWNEKKAAGRSNTPKYTKHQINEVDEADSDNGEDHQYDDENFNATYDEIDEICVPYSEFTEEEDLAYYNDN